MAAVPTGSGALLLDAEDEVRLARSIEAGKKAQQRLESGERIKAAERATLYRTIEAADKAEEDKVFTSLGRLAEEDPALNEFKNNPMYRYLILLVIASTMGLQGWQTLFNNFAVEIAGLQGVHVGAIQSVRELPGFLALLALVLRMFGMDVPGFA